MVLVYSFTPTGLSSLRWFGVIIISAIRACKTQYFKINWIAENVIVSILSKLNFYCRNQPRRGVNILAIYFNGGKNPVGVTLFILRSVCFIMSPLRGFVYALAIMLQ